jgi:hypothetical protein
MGTDSNRGEIVDPEIFTEPSVISDGEIPREFHPHAGLDIDCGANLRSKPS